MPKWLTKSRYLNGLQCPKLLWLTVHEPSRIPEPDAALQQVFDQGHLVGELAKQLFPDGVNVPDDDLFDNINLTKDMLSQRVPLFEAGILAGRLYSRVDILKPSGSDAWDIVEVKSATSVKDVNIDDIAFQKLVCTEKGITVDKCYLVCLNSDYVRHGDIVPEELFAMHDVTDDVAERYKTIREQVDDVLRLMDSAVCPATDIGPHCTNPYDCLLDECWGKLPEHSVFTMYRGKQKAHELYREGVVDIKDIPADCKLNEKQQIQINSVVRNEVYLDKAQIRDFLSELVYPLYYLDFETIGPAVPLFDDSRPYQNITFQYSLHVQSAPHAKTEHCEFLAEGPEDPRPALMEKLRRDIGGTGSVITYNMSFEKKRLEEMAEVYPEYADWVADINARMIDLIVPFRAFHYYNPEQKGSASLKYVLPAITGTGYKGMDIGDGGEASRRFYHATYEDASPEEIRKTRESLIIYCGQDTEGMVWIIDALWNMVSRLI